MVCVYLDFQTPGLGITEDHKHESSQNDMWGDGQKRLTL